MSLLLVCAAGGLGAVARFVVDGLVSRHRRGALPLGTLVINIGGSFLLGLVTGLAVRHAGFPAAVESAVGTGFCGGFTTFSTASVDVVGLWEADGPRPGITYAVLTLAGSVLGAALGWWAGSLG